MFESSCDLLSLVLTCDLIWDVIGTAAGEMDAQRCDDVGLFNDHFA